METSKQLANRFREVLLNGVWIANTNYKDQLSQLTWTQATTKIGSLNTIAALTFHINYYIDGLVKVFEGGPLEIRDKYSFDCAPVESAEDWEKRRSNLFADAETFARAVEQMSPNQLEAVFVKDDYGNYRRNIEAIIEHAYYHLGQISLIRKMITESGKK